VKIISIGEVLWDVFGDQEHLGGASFNFSAHLSKLGHEVAFISAIGNDIRGQRILDRMAQMGLSTRYIRLDPDHNTGIVSVTVDELGQPKFILHRPAAYDFPEIPEPELRNLLSQPTDWIYFGTLHQMSLAARHLTARLLDSGNTARRFYDVNLRPNSYDSALVRELMERATVVKLNDEEVSVIARMFNDPFRSLERFCREYARRFGWEAVCITRGPKGCALLAEDEYIEAPGYTVGVVDTVGAGDAFAAAFVHGLGRGWIPARITDFANRVGATVASRRGAIPDWTIAEVEALHPHSYRQEPA
jgi:fructokinase